MIDNGGVRERVLERLRISVAQTVPIRFLQDMDVRIIDDLAAYATAVIQREVWAEKLQDDSYETSVEFPASAWQLFKRDHLPKWFKDRWPVRNIKTVLRVEFKRYAMYPDFTPTTPKDLQHYVVHEQRVPNIREWKP